MQRRTLRAGQTFNGHTVPQQFDGLILRKNSQPDERNPRAMLAAFREWLALMQNRTTTTQG